MKQKTKVTLKRNAKGLLFVAPLIVYFLVFQLAPMIIAFVISFMDYDGLNPAIWMGLGNYRAIILNEEHLYDFFGKSILVTVEYILLTVPLNILLSLVVSALLNTKIKGEKFFKTAFYIPSVTVGVAIMTLWRYMLDPSYGLINEILGTNINFLGTPGLNLVTLAIMSVWGGLGYNTLIMLSAMKNIDQSLYEAASIEGANGFKQFWSITVPGVMPTVFFFLITGIIGGFQAFEQMYLLTGKGGASNSTFTVIYGVYEQSITNGHLGIGSAMSFVVFLIILVFTAIQFKTLPQDSMPRSKKQGRLKTFIKSKLQKSEKGGVSECQQ